MTEQTLVEIRRERAPHCINASKHPETGNLRISICGADGWQFFFFRDRDEALDWLDDVAEMVEGGAE